MSPLWLNLFIIVPVVAYKVARRRAPQHVYSITGASLGAVIAPISFGLYSWYFVSVVGFVPGMTGLILVMIHEAPGFHLAVHFELVPVGKVVTGVTQHAIIDILSGVVWLTCYGAIGYAIDRIRRKRKPVTANGAR